MSAAGKQAVHPVTGARQSIAAWGERAADGGVFVDPESFDGRADTPLLGRVFDGRYAVYAGRRLPNSVVYSATHLLLDADRHVFIKHVRADHPHRELAERRLRQEGRFLARLPKHPNLPQLYDLVEQGGTLHLVCERAPGTALSEVLATVERLPLAAAVEILDAVLAGLSVCHAAGVVHRDLKPSNIMVDRGAALRVVLVDFGIAKDVDGTVTDLGTRLQPGTPAYMSPEQAWNGTITPRSDVYSAAAVLHRILTGRPPPPPGEGAAIELDDAVPQAARAVLERGLAVFPEGRFADASEMRAALAPLLASPRPAAIPLSSTDGGTEHGTDHERPAPPAEPARRSPIGWFVLLALGAGLAAGRWSAPSALDVRPAPVPDVQPASATTRPGPPADASIPPSQPADAARPTRPPDAAPPDARPPDAAPPDAGPTPAPATVARQPKPRPARPRGPAVPRKAVRLAERIRSEYVDRCRCGPAYGAALERLRAMRGGETLIQARDLKRCVHLFSPDLQRCEDGRPVMKEGR